ncbi:MAG TPA: hypothetical protein VMA77_20685 [Solirubrobacteraceae bacterium]|nr:hypothetical protein [Solirubrobacteraceae bacterium]
MAEGLSATEVGKDIADHRDHAERSEHPEGENAAGAADKYVLVRELPGPP